MLMVQCIYSESSLQGARNIRAWARQFEDKQTLPISGRGKHPKVLSLMNDPDICIPMRAYLRSNKWSTDPSKLKEYTNGAFPKEIAAKYAREIANSEMPEGLRKFMREELFPGIGLQLIKPISVSTARRWMRREGFRYLSYQKGLYCDGHDRPDVLDYRKNIFIPFLEAHRHRIFEWDDDVEKAIFKPGPWRPLIPLFHDESTFTANDGVRKSWVLDRMHKLRKKGAGRGVHRSDFIDATGGWLAQAGRQMNYGKNHDGYWTGDDVVKQLSEVNGAIDIFEQTHPVAQALFIFDNSSGHGVYANDALVARRMNAGAGGKDVPVMRDGWYMIGDLRICQAMVDANGIPRGTRSVLEERGFNLNGINAKSANEAEHREDNMCCQRRLLSVQPDFKEQKNALQEIIEARGKFHCELNI